MTVPRFSVRVNNDLSPSVLRELVRIAEESGFDQFWVSNDLYLRSAPALLGLLAAHTDRIVLGTAVMNPYSVHVVELAMLAATVQEMTGGRFALGVGAGSAEFLGWAGLARPAPVRTTRESVAALRVLLGHDDVDEGLLPAWFREERRLAIPVAAPVPVYVGAMGPLMLRMAGACGDGALPLLYPPERYAAVRRELFAGLDAAGRRRDTFDLPACVWVSVDADAEAARRALANKLAYYGPSIAPVVLADAGLRPDDFAAAARVAQRGDDAAHLIDARMLALGIAGSTDDVVLRCRSLLALGAEHLSFGPPLGPDPAAALALLGAEVLPALRAPGPG